MQLEVSPSQSIGIDSKYGGRELPWVGVGVIGMVMVMVRVHVRNQVRVRGRVKVEIRGKVRG